MKLVQSLIKNAIVSVAVQSAVSSFAKDIPEYIHSFVRNKLVTRVSVISYDDAFKWIELWLANNEYAANSNSFRLVSRSSTSLSIDSENSEVKWILTTGDGTHRFIRDRNLVTVTRSQGGQGKAQFEVITIEVFGKNKALIEKFLEEAKSQMAKDTTTHIHMYNGYWYKVASKSPRHESTIILAGGQKERIFKDLETFYNNKEWYAKRGIPYHRGYLFAGVPGSGKTSMVDAMASKFKKSIAVINVSALKTDDDLYDAFLSVPKNTIIVLEDIDCISASHSRDEKKKDSKQGVTLAGLLNCLDGIVTPEGAVIVMTTNYPDKLDSALIRPGRADVHETFHHLGKEEQRKLSALYYDTPIKGIDKSLSASVLQSIFMSYPHDKDGAQRELEKLT